MGSLHKECPFFNDNCIGSHCAWWVEDNCAVLKILEALVEIQKTGQSDS
ncbi:MAG: hypothetical protein ACYS47_09300 [Planctomycetota bacterium]|jgi:hypothetical protein